MFKIRLFYTVLAGLLLITALPTIAEEDDSLETVGVSPEVIAEYPEPNVTPLFLDEGILYDRIYRRVSGATSIHDAPGGSVVQTLDAGYNYVTLNAQPQGEWAQINGSQWMPTASLTNEVTISRFVGVELPEEGLPYTMAWTLRHVRASETPGGDASEDNPFMYRYTRVNIYETVEIDGFNWYQIGENQWIHQFDVAKILPVDAPEEVNTEKWVSIDLYEQVLIAYEGDTPVFGTLISSGLPQWSTNEGTFNVYLRRQRTVMSGAYGQPDFYYLEDVPWTMFFDGDIGLHGTYWHDGFGYRQSHGCVNLSIIDAHWLYHWSSDVRDFDVEDSPDIAIHVYSSGEYE